MYSPALVCLCVSVSLCDHDNKKIVDGFAPHFMRRFLGGVRVSLRSVEGCGCNGQKTT